MSNTRYIFMLRRLATILAVTTLTLSLIAALTGVLIAFYYGPNAGSAYDEIKQIVNEVPNGWLIQSLHNTAGNGLIAVCLVQMVVMFLGRQFRQSWLAAWIGGIALTMTAIALGWSAMNLGWTQLGYWRFKIELGTIESVPLIGPLLREILTGGEAIGTVAIQHLYALHSYVLSMGALILSILHLLGLLVQEREQKQVEALLIDTETPEISLQQEPSQAPKPLEVQVNQGFT
jgi:cytochrome b6